jgi:UDP-N-acetylmuramate dehydrogenase
MRIQLDGRFEPFARFDEPMSVHTAFKVGGPADVYINFAGLDFAENAAALLRFARENGLALTVIGGGSNIVVADAGIRGITLDTRLDGGQPSVSTGTAHAARIDEEGRFAVPAGMLSDAAAEAAAALSLSGLEFLAGLPGTVGGAVWMNARCWGRSVSDALAGADVLDEGLRAVFEPVQPDAWDYKRSPYQGRDALILAARFRLERGDEAAIRRAMAGYRLEREQKGHFRLPSAGSVFKNDRSLGKSAGQIIDELGLRGLSIGGAQVAAWHGNFIVNAGGATATDIRALTEAVRAEARRRLGITLEPEILFIGDWG